MITITKTIKVKADYDITEQFDNVEDLLRILRYEVGYEGEYDETNPEFIEALDTYFDTPLTTQAFTRNLGNQHEINDIQVDTENFETYYTF